MIGAEQVVTDRWVRGRLEASADLFDAISPGLSQRIFLDFAPDATKYPYLVFQCQSPPRDVRGVGLTRVLVDTLYVVKAVSQVQSYDPLAPIANVIDLAMTSAEGGLVQGGQILAAVRDRQFSMVEIDSGTQFRHFGGEYRIQAQAA